MSVHSQDPTPCPRPRHGLTQRAPPRLSMLCDADPSVTLPRVGLRDAKPRRPGRRPSVGWDPTIDICEDTFQLQKAPTSAEARSVIPDLEPTLALEAAKLNRRSTIFAQPAQKLSAGSHASMHQPVEGRTAHKRRLSSITGSVQPMPRPTRSESCLVNPGPDTLRAAGAPDRRGEARRRTIYVPSEDTTIATIHPGRSLKDQTNRAVRPRRSDVFLDILSEETEASPMVEDSEKAAQPRPNRAPRTSILAAPRRAPLQQSTKQLQPQASVIDVPGNGGGKENQPPVFGDVKRLGKRASFIIPEKQAVKRQTMLAPVMEFHSAQAAPQSPMAEKHQLSTQGNRQSHASQSRRARESLGVQPRRTSLFVKPRESIVPRDGFSLNRPDPPIMAPTALKAPRLSLATTSSLEKYPVIREDVADPSLYEDNWLQHQEQGMTQLINSLFERAHGKSSASPLRVDEQATLRQELLDVYQGTEMSYLHRRLLASLQFGALNIPVDTLAQVARFKDDYGQRQRFLDLWIKTYSLDALQTAAEVVVGRQRSASPRNSGSGSPTKSNVKSATSYLKTFLVQNQDASQHGDSPSCLSANRGSSKTDLDVAGGWRRTVLRSLMLIYLLDQAQVTNKLRGCLFLTTSPYKSSLAVLQGLCRILIPSVGDVGRVLGHLGYSLIHNQHPLEEYDYQITNIATDLRDGVRLTRLVELLLYPSGNRDSTSVTTSPTIKLASGEILPLASDAHTSPLSQHLKHPCISRTQKVHNTSIALAALANTSNTGHLLDNIRPEDLVDGHREKTIRLLWGLVSRWGLEGLVNFDLVRREISRLRRAHPELVDPLSVPDADDNLARCKSLLHAWAAAAASPQGVSVPNLSTAFADGAAYRAILATYTAYIPSVPSVGSPESAGSMSSSRFKNEAGSTLTKLGCSQSFHSLFPSSSAQPSSVAPQSVIPSSKTTIPLLAFLAARLLPAAAPAIAAERIQRAWRAWSGRRRRACARLAREAAFVVHTRERIEWAARVLQRRWRGAHWL